MNNTDIAEVLKNTATLMELHQENEFKIRAFNSAAFALERLETDVNQMSASDLTAIKGLGKSIVSKIETIKSQGELPELVDLIQKTPVGVMELLKIKGLGPKKVKTIWNELGIESPGELLYACNENRLITMKGFGEKTQEQIKKSLEFSFSNKGKFHYASIEPIAIQLMEIIKHGLPQARVEFCGEFRRRCEIITHLEFLIDQSFDPDELKEIVHSTNLIDIPGLKISNATIEASCSNGLSLSIHSCKPDSFTHEWIQRSGNTFHLEFLTKNGYTGNESVQTEEDLYTCLQIPYIVPELREGLIEEKVKQQQKAPDLITFKDLKGVLHNHSTYSDGIHTLQQMAMHCQKLGFEYFAICDHSKTAVYAGGLTEENIIKQHKEIDELNALLQPFKILKGIESDILTDGSLDYADEILASFDLIVASIHSGFKMDESKATARLIKAISNPYTTILGHPTGRLLLSREGYPVNHKEIIDACAQYNVAIELNAHPYRLDMDWRWIQYACEKNVMISINPDAHEKDGIMDMHYGVLAARKGGLSPKQCLNALPLTDFLSLLSDSKK